MLVKTFVVLWPFSCLFDDYTGESTIQIPNAGFMYMFGFAYSKMMDVLISEYEGRPISIIEVISSAKTQIL